MFRILNIAFTILLFYPAIAFSQTIQPLKGIKEPAGAIVRSDTTDKTIYFMLTAHEYGEGIPTILKTFDEHHIKASFFFTGDFTRKNRNLVKLIHKKGHYVGPHSDKHLLYCDWTKRDSLLIPIDSILNDLKSNIKELEATGILKNEIRFFMPPYEWYNQQVYEMTKSEGLTLINFTPGTSSNADYTTPEMKNYVSSDTIMNRILRYESTHASGLNGFHLLIHAGTDPNRKDKLYFRLNDLIKKLQELGYKFNRIAMK